MSKLNLNSIDSINKEQWDSIALYIIDEKYTFLIKRSEDVPSFKGHLAFIGGHKQMDESIEQTAKREFIEETGLDADDLLFEGLLPVVETGKSLKVAPVVAQYKNGIKSLLERARSNGEWSFCLMVKNDVLRNPKQWKSAGVYVKNTFVMPIMFNTLAPHQYKSSYRGDEHLVLWGATAKMICSFYDI